MIKTFIFDLGNVIVPFEAESKIKSLQEFTRLKPEDVHEKVLLSEELRLFETGKISSLEVFDFVKKTLDSEMSFEQFIENWNGIFILEPILSEDFIGKLSKKYKLLILSDTNEIHFEFIKKNFPVLKYFDDFVLSYEVGVLKPSKEIFQIAVEKAGCLPEECFFTDDIEKNVAAAKNLGINTVQFISAEQFEKHLLGLSLIEKKATLKA
ncbi:MAG: HAD family phosphatase [Acidobacteriota bacterium]|jgi:putative hydrolase of the HAD superfamily|nr:HAD family phosphatase [Acidobacteriota bacterium]